MRVMTSAKKFMCLDISGPNVRAVEVSSNDQGVRLERSASGTLGDETFENRPPMEKALALRRFLAANGFTAKHAVCSIP
jgi:Tfp pilus assembly PilM family ATPase